MTIGAILFAAGVALTAQAAGASPLRIATSGHYPPYFIALGGQSATGLDVDLLTDICARGNYDCTWTELPTEDLLPALVAGQVDVVAGGIGVNAARLQIVDFTCPYFQMDGANGELVMRNPDLDLSQAVIAVSQSSLYEQSMRKAGMQVLLFSNELDAAAAMVNGTADGYFGSSEVVRNLGADVPVTMVGTYPTVTGGAAFAVSKDAPDLLAALNSYLADISREGHLSELQVRWLAQDQGDVIANCLDINALS